MKLKYSILFSTLFALSIGIQTTAINASSLDNGHNSDDYGNYDVNIVMQVGEFGLIVEPEAPLLRRIFKYVRANPGMCAYYALQGFQLVVAGGGTAMCVAKAYEAYDRNRIVSEDADALCFRTAQEEFNRTRDFEKKIKDDQACTEQQALNSDLDSNLLQTELIKCWAEGVRWSLPDNVQFPAEVIGYCITPRETDPVTPTRQPNDMQPIRRIIPSGPVKPYEFD